MSMIDRSLDGLTFLSGQFGAALRRRLREIGGMALLGIALAACLALLLPIAIWGYRLLGHRPLSRERLRVMLWVFAAGLSAGFASCLPRSAHWPLPCGLGGVVGDAVLRLPTELFGV